MSGRLNMLAVGSNPKILYYLWRLQATNKLNVHLVDEEIGSPQQAKITFHDDSIGSEYTLTPEVCVGQFNQLSQTKYDLILLACKSLQDISNTASNLAPFIGKKTIIMLESTGFVNLEPFLKNCLPQDLKLAVFSIISTVNVRKVTPTQFIVKDSLTREIILGESGTANTKYPTSAQQDLGALVKLLQFQQTDNTKISSKNTYLEFLVEQWKLAIPRICFNPLLILFEEKNPEDLTKQILAKPLLSGLVTELITVAKTMGCKLPVGHDNESNLLKRWIEDNKSVTHNDQVKLIDSPQFFYDFYHKNNLDIDMLLLQPILLADDHGIKTPYLEFLYATICQYDKLNSTSMFFKRDDGVDVKALQLENDRLNSTLSKQIDEYKTLLRTNEQLQIQRKDLSEKDTKLTQLMTSFQGLQVEHQDIQQKYQQKSKMLQQAESRIQHLQSQPAPVPVPVPVPAPQRAAPQVPQPQAPQPQQPQAYPYQQQQTPRVDRSLAQRQEVSIDGTPDLRDLTDYALYGAAIESPTKNQVAPQAEPVLEQKVPQVPTDAPPPTMQLSSPPAQQPQQYQPASQDLVLSTRELELKKKEALLNNREMELNKKWSHLNGRNPQQLQPPLQPMKQRAGPPMPQQQQQQQQQFGPQQQQPFMPQQQQFAPQQQQPFIANGMSMPQQMPQPRRVSTMPVMDSEQLYGGMTRGGMNGAHNPHFKKASRKNRKSSFPLVATAGLGDNYSQLRPNGGTRHASMMTGSNPMMSSSAPTSAGSMIQPQGILPSASQMNGLSGGGGGGAYSPTIKPNPQFQQQPQRTRPSPNGSNHELNNYGSYPNSNSSNEMNGNGQAPVVNGNGTGIVLNGQSNGNGGADTSFGSVVVNEGEVEAKPLGYVGAPLGNISGEKKEKKKKFGMFGKK